METPETSNPRRPRWCDDLRPNRYSYGLAVLGLAFLVLAGIGTATLR